MLRECRRIIKPHGRLYLSVPNGFTEGGLPTGVQFMGRAYSENAILAVARAYQSMTDWHKRHPPGL